MCAAKPWPGSREARTERHAHRVLGAAALYRKVPKPTSGKTVSRGPLPREDSESPQARHCGAALPPALPRGSPPFCSGRLPPCVGLGFPQRAPIRIRGTPGAGDNRKLPFPGSQRNPLCSTGKPQTWAPQHIRICGASGYVSKGVKTSY